MLQLINKCKRGFTIFESLIVVAIVGIISILFCCLIIQNKRMYKQNIQQMEYIIFIQNNYELFSADPFNYNKNVEKIYHGVWKEKIYKFTEYPDFSVELIENQNNIILNIFYQGGRIETWQRSTKKEV